MTHWRYATDRTTNLSHLEQACINLSNFSSMLMLCQAMLKGSFYREKATIGRSSEQGTALSSTLLASCKEI